MSPWRKNELVVCLNKMFAGFKIVHLDGVRVGMNGGYLVVRLHFYAKPIPKAFGALQRQCAFLFDYATNEVGTLVYPSCFRKLTALPLRPPLKQ